MRILALYTGAFSAGIFLAQYVLPPERLPLYALCALIISFGRLRLPRNAGRRILLIGTGMAFAFGWNFLYTRMAAEPLQALSGTETELSMTLCDYPEPSAFGARVTVETDIFRGKLVYYGKTSLLELLPGQKIYDRVRFQDASRLREDDLTVFTSRGIFLLAYGRGTPVTDVAESAVDSPRWWPVRTARAVREMLYALLPEDSAAFLTALLTGNRSGLSVRSAADISEAGLSHILAVSGMHCGFLLSVIVLLAGRQKRYITALCGIPVLIFYAVLTGGKPSVIRACIMLFFVLIAPLFYRAGDALTSLCTALFLILLHNPFAAASVSLQLSFASVAGLLTITPHLYVFLSGDSLPGLVTDVPTDVSGENPDAPPDDTDEEDLDEPELEPVQFHLREWIRPLLAASFSATVGVMAFTAPLSAYYFGFLPLVTFFSNPLCLWAAEGAFASGLFTLAVKMILPPLAPLAALVPEMLSRYILQIAGILAKLPFHALCFENPFLKYWLIYVYVLFAAVYVQEKIFVRRAGISEPKNSVRSVMIPLVLSGATLVFVLNAGYNLYRAPLDVTVLDVGQGESVIFASGGHFVLMDCGSSNSWYDPGVTAAHQLEAMGCNRLDALILSHYDTDHVNGVEDVMVRIPVGILFLPASPDNGSLQSEILATAERYQIPVRFVEEREQFLFGSAILTVYPPVGISGDNERGLSVLAGTSETEILVTGDMGANTEHILMNRYELPDIEALVAGHHGSRYSTSEELLETLSPETVCISVGSNSYGHPAEDTLARLRAYGCTVLRTDLHGNIHLSLYPD